MSTSELACSYAALILGDDNIPVTADKISAILKAAKVEVEPYWPELFANLFKTRSVADLVSNAGAVGAAAPTGGAAAPAAAAAAPAAGGAKEEKKKEEKKEEPEEDDDMGFGLFD